MRRRRTLPDSSLDLFLDTISNTFGGIILVAILLSILVQNRTQEPLQAQESPQTITLEEAQQIVSQVDRLQALQSQLTESVAHLESQRPRPDQAELVLLHKEVDQKEKQLAGQLRQQAVVSQKVAQQLEATAEIRKELEETGQQLIDLTVALEVDRTALDKAMDEQLEILKLPRVSEARKSNVILLMRYGKVFPVYQANSDLPFEEHVDLDTVLSTSKITPKLSGGWELKDPSGRANLNEYLDRYSSDYNILSVAVWPDSYSDFSSLRQLAVEKGFSYQLWPLTEVPALLVSPTTDQLPRVQ